MIAADHGSAREESRRRPSGSPPGTWLRGPVFDSLGLAWCWVPFYLWVVFGLGLGREGWGWDALTRSEGRAALASATVVALGITYVHRHYTFILVYGDRETFDRRARAFIVAPIAVIALVSLGRALDGTPLGRIGPTPIDTWLAILTVTGLWNVWHTIQQRYGILRVYAGRAGAGLQRPEHARRDRGLLWASVTLVALCLVFLRPETFAGHGNARRVLRTLGPFREHPLTLMAAAVVGIVAVVVLAWWGTHELRADMAGSRRIPRTSFVASTLGLFAVFVVHGPIVGYLCFGTAHAIEYVFFLHHFGHAKFTRRPDVHGPVATALRHPWRWAPLISGALLLLYVALLEQRRTEIYLIYYTSTSLLHFLFDGWIWKVRRPEVARPLGVTPTATPAP